MKITSEHLSRAACVYIRQSTADQLINNPESRRPALVQGRLLPPAMRAVLPSERHRLGDALPRDLRLVRRRQKDPLDQLDKSLFLPF